MAKKIGKLGVALVLILSVSVVLTMPIDIIPPLGGLFDPFSGIWTIYQDAEHPASSTVQAPGHLLSPVTVIRDSWGVPHIYADHETDLFFAFGYVQAQDRLWQMDITRRQGRGRLAEILGPDYISADIFLRSIGLEYAAQQTLDLFMSATDPYNVTLRNNLLAFTEGVNFYIGQLGNRLPLEFKLLNYRPEPWTLVDSFAIARILDYGLSWMDVDLSFAKAIDHFGNTSAWELFPLNPPLQIPVVPEYGVTYVPPPAPSDIAFEKLPEALHRSIDQVLSWTEHLADPMGILAGWQDDFVGSNNWAVNSTKSATGKPILCNDMHLPRDVPPIWYQAHLVASDTQRNIYGFCPPGVPLIIAGHTERVAWGFTNVGADVIDWYYYNTNPANSNQYWYNGAWQDFEEETTYIHVKGAPPVPHTIRRTVHGPVLSDTGFAYNGYALAQRWTGAEPSFEYIALDKMTMAHNYSEFIEGQQYWWTISQNIVFADVEGNIAIRPTGHWPIRADGYGRLPNNGSAGEGEWVGFIPFDQLPLSLNPSRGYVVSANQLAAVQGPTAYPYYIHSYTADGYRARRINYLLENDDSVTVEDMKRIQLDALDTAAQALVPFIIDAFDNAPPAITNDLVLAAAVDELRGWNFTMLQDWSAPTIWWAWLLKYRDAIFLDEYPADPSGMQMPAVVVMENLTRFNPSSRWFNDTRTSSTETRDDIIIRALQQAVGNLTAEEGSDVAQWTWNKFHFIVYTHLVGSALGHGPFPADGDVFTVNPSHADIWRREQGASRGGASERLIVDFNDPFHALSVIPGGQRGHPLSHHYSDQLFQLFLVGDYHIDYLYSDSNLLTDRESILLLTG